MTGCRWCDGFDRCWLCRSAAVGDAAAVLDRWRRRRERVHFAHTRGIVHRGVSRAYDVDHDGVVGRGWDPGWPALSIEALNDRSEAT